MNQLPWTEAIEKVIGDLGGAASLDKMYESIPQYRDLSANKQWKATLRGILYRDMKQRNRIVRLGLGIFGFAGTKKKTLFQKVEAKDKVVTPSQHSSIQGMLIEMGNFYGFDTYTADPSASFDGKKLGNLASLQQMPSFVGYADLLDQAKKIDVIWFEKNTTRPFPIQAYEVENTPEFRRSMLKLYQLRNFTTEFFLVAQAAKESLFATRLNNDPYNKVKERFQFRSFEDVTALYISAAEHFILQEKFFPSSNTK